MKTTEEKMQRKRLWWLAGLFLGGWGVLREWRPKTPRHAVVRSQNPLGRRDRKK